MKKTLEKINELVEAAMLNYIAEAKVRYHKSIAKIPFEEKVKIIIELQKIDAEMRKGCRKQTKAKYREVWKIQ